MSDAIRAGLVLKTKDEVYVCAEYVAHLLKIEVNPTTKEVVE